jgi:hypothetical protein
MSGHLEWHGFLDVEDLAIRNILLPDFPGWLGPTLTLSQTSHPGIAPLLGGKSLGVDAHYAGAALGQ